MQPATLSRVSYRILSWGGGGGGEGGGGGGGRGVVEGSGEGVEGVEGVEGGRGGGGEDSRMIVCEKCVPTRGSGGMPLQKNFEFRSSQIVSDIIWNKSVV